MQLGKWIRLMHVLINTTNYEYGQVKDKMDATFTHRQRFIQEMKPTTEIVELYPSLSVFYSQLVREINLYSDSLNAHIVLALKLNCIKLIKYLDQQRKQKKILMKEAIDADTMIQIRMIKNIKNYSIVIKYNTFITTNSQVEITVISLIGLYEIFNIEY
ncbi:unnamed protein product [Rotaria sordida]|uniref:Uncharacterized protein n=1 Tax=Rotaria sordida TaxID=392033 RepID=A0A814PZE9_9BILA|nr:unnamed protein product [Rotaria sordida]